MKTLLLLLLTMASASAQLIGNSAPYRGNYFGVMVPSPKCSNERLGIDITMDAEGRLEGQVRNWDNLVMMEFSQSWPFFDKGRFTTDITQLDDFVKGKATTAGVLKGTARVNGCVYTFTAYRRFKVAQ